MIGELEVVIRRRKIRRKIMSKNNSLPRQRLAKPNHWRRVNLSEEKLPNMIFEVDRCLPESI
jgi:hypothetical protein